MSGRYAPRTYSPALTADVTAPWRDRASCAGRPGVMDGPDRTAARAMCGACPVIAQCARWVLALYAIEDPDGIVAGMDRKQRIATRARIAARRRKGRMA